ncbi:YheC/YheD family endospore coat-associated protein [Alicyclobacillus shizuokensis]|uniref:YheC/YheD family endospore coat-associated protein n=1 Tax=Alicyclobacillus shizuokensis TaxID=392014 RepID=UPI000834F5B4|nr:YheC/YheD family protein [Alicyclobacillus shizuokensis]
MVRGVGPRLVWLDRGGRLEMAVLWRRSRGSRRQRAVPVLQRVRVSNLLLPCYESVPGRVVFSAPLTWQRLGDGVAEAGPVFAILAGGRDGKFVGNRAHFRDLIRIARGQDQFVYVLPDDRVDGGDTWLGFVRVRSGVWRQLPCPQPQAVYNRIPQRHLERSPVAVRARQTLRERGIPMFNPEYFNKAVLYRVLATSELSHYLPQSTFSITSAALGRMLAQHGGVYLKPVGGSMGHGIMRVERMHSGYRVQVLKKGRTKSLHAANLAEVRQVVKRERIGGAYVMQAAKPLLDWRGHPCDFRVLLQKQNGVWRVVGVGVRAAGDGVITTHVPNGGFIVDADSVLHHHFGPRRGQIAHALERMACACARRIDQYYREQLGEMSMDIGVDREGNLWFFEANSKPMKFDEPEIWRQGLRGTLMHLAERAAAAPAHARR